MVAIFFLIDCIVIITLEQFMFELSHLVVCFIVRGIGIVVGG